ncbi:hypothetical protein DV711_11030 [Motiliproteus coralliicola]|uniref:Uncharacterized protein n=1 Tax=Motiliproteus coralliicola TaxID=2283196 RepID=A0A369WCH0_9GAMM|nr:hypothetical protein [Motiliproteus coralliicola]RDE19422.1 hypothetical protein DV711_11030 [Motiliproteus coralliicola]
MEQTYFESGKVTGAALRAFLFSSFIAIIFLASSSQSDLIVPFINLKLKYENAVSVIMFIDSCFFYRFIAAANYERELKDRLLAKNDNSLETVWLLTYPNIWNFHQFSPALMSRNDKKTVLSMLIIPLLAFSLGIPVWAFVKAVSSGFNYSSIFILAVCFTIFLITYTGLIKPINKKDKKVLKSDTDKTGAA